MLLNFFVKMRYSPVVMLQHLLNASLKFAKGSGDVKQGLNALDTNAGAQGNGGDHCFWAHRLASVFPSLAMAGRQKVSF
jgi:hypothetical protein